MNLVSKRSADKSHLAPAFTLIELLVVLAIVSLLLVASVPVFSNSSNNSRQTSREIIKAHLRQARAHAIATGTSIAVAIPTIAASKELGARSISLFEVELENGTYIPRKDDEGNDLQIQRTAVLPGNFYFVSSSNISASTATIVDLPETMPTSFRNVQHDCHVIVFAPNGQIVRPVSGTAINIAIAQATRSGDSLTLTQRTGDTPVFELFQVNRLTGRTRFIEP